MKKTISIGKFLIAVIFLLVIIAVLIVKLNQTKAEQLHQSMIESIEFNTGIRFPENSKFQLYYNDQGWFGDGEGYFEIVIPVSEMESFLGQLDEHHWAQYNSEYYDMYFNNRIGDYLDQNKMPIKAFGKGRLLYMNITQDNRILLDLSNKETIYTQDYLLCFYDEALGRFFCYRFNS